MHDQSAADSGRKTGIPWMAIWTVAAFLGGNLVSVSMGWGTRSSQLDGLVLEVSRLSSQIGKLSDSYTVSDRAVGIELENIKGHMERVEDHLTHADSRLDRLEARQR